MLLNGCFHIDPVLCPSTVVLGRGQLYWHEAKPRANTADRDPIQLYEDIIQDQYENTHFMTPLLTKDLK